MVGNTMNMDRILCIPGTGVIRYTDNTPPPPSPLPPFYCTVIYCTMNMDRILSIPGTGVIRYTDNTPPTPSTLLLE